MGMSSILLFVIYPYRFCLFQHLIDIPGFFGIFSAVWVVDFQSAILQSGKNDKMTVAGKLPGSHQGNDGVSGLQVVFHPFPFHRNFFAGKADLPGSFQHQRPGGSAAVYGIAVL